MPDVVATLSAAVAVAKKLRDLAATIKDAEVKGLVADLNLTMADLKLQCAELQAENVSLKADLRKAQQARDFRKDLWRSGETYRLKNPPEGYEKGPYCSRCVDVDERLVLLVSSPLGVDDFGPLRCPSCNSMYKG